MLAFTVTQSKLKAFEYHGMKIYSFILARNFSVNLYLHLWSCEITKLLWQRSVRLSAKMALTFKMLYVMNEEVRALKDALKNTAKRAHQEGSYHYRYFV